jgi:hypothetical protein
VPLLIFAVANISLGHHSMCPCYCLLWPISHCCTTQCAPPTVCCGQHITAAPHNVPLLLFAVANISLVHHTMCPCYCLLWPTSHCCTTQCAPPTVCCGQHLTAAPHNVPLLLFAVANILLLHHTMCPSCCLLWPTSHFCTTQCAPATVCCGQHLTSAPHNND